MLIPNASDISMAATGIFILLEEMKKSGMGADYEHKRRRCVMTTVEPIHDRKKLEAMKKVLKARYYSGIHKPSTLCYRCIMATLKLLLIIKSASQIRGYLSASPPN